jgi:pilus assembly protein FimV
MLARQLATERPEDAARHLREVLEIDPDNEPAENMLRRLARGAALPMPPAIGDEGLAPPEAPENTDPQARRQVGDLEAEAGSYAALEEEVEVFQDAGTTGTLNALEEMAAKAAHASVPVPLIEFEESDEFAAEFEPEEASAPAEDSERGVPIEHGREPEPMATMGEPTPVEITPVLMPSGMDDVSAPADGQTLVPPPEILGSDEEESSHSVTGKAARSLREAQDVLSFEPSAPLESPQVTGKEPPTDQSSAVAASDGNIEDELDEIEFFVQQGLTDQACEMLEEMLGRHPNHPLVLAKLREVKGVDEAAMPPAPPPPPPPMPPPPDNLPTLHTEPGTPRALASALLPDPGQGTTAPSAPSPDREGDRARRSMVEQDIDTKDFETHYDLGIAYKEMGLYNDAIREFEIIAQAPGREVVCHTMIGLCFSAKGMQTEAISQFKKGLYVDGITDREAISLYYELGIAYEKLADPREALYYYEKVAKRDAKFRDVQRRVESVKALSPGSSRGPGADAGSGEAPPKDDLAKAIEEMVGDQGKNGSPRN